MSSMFLSLKWMKHLTTTDHEIARCNIFQLMSHMQVEHIIELNVLHNGHKMAKNLSILQNVGHVLVQYQYIIAPLIDNLLAAIVSEIQVSSLFCKRTICWTKHDF